MKAKIIVKGKNAREYETELHGLPQVGDKFPIDENKRATVMRVSLQGGKLPEIEVINPVFATGSTPPVSDD